MLRWETIEVLLIWGGVRKEKDEAIKIRHAGSSMMEAIWSRVIDACETQDTPISSVSIFLIHHSLLLPGLQVQVHVSHRYQVIVNCTHCIIEAYHHNCRHVF